MKINLRKLPLNIYLSLFIFCMINREFLLFGLDLRFVMVPLGILLIIFYLFLHRGVIYIRRDENYKQFNYLMLFYLWVFLSNISWLWNGLPMNQEKLINELILLMNIFISIIVIRLYENEISSTYIKKNIIVSSFILVVSMILVSMGFSNSQILASPDEPLVCVTANGVKHTNLFGWDFRPAGYAADPNYATILLLIAYCCVLKLNTSKFKKFLLLIPIILGISLAFSKTVLIATFFTILYIFFLRTTVKNKQKELFLTKVLFMIFVIASVIMPFITEIQSILPKTMTGRLFMWESAVRIFIRSPIIGSGITSARSFFSIISWFVQTHNTYLQILSETGVVGIILFYLLMSNTLKSNYKNIIDFFITIVFIIFMIDFETIALQFFLYVTLLCQIDRKEDLEDGKQEESLIYDKYSV